MWNIWMGSFGSNLFKSDILKSGSLHLAAIIRIYHECESEIKQIRSEVQEDCQVMTNGDREDKLEFSISSSHD